jgi:hypothetical protein
MATARLCTDNGVMVAWAGIERLRLGALDDPSDMEVRARWPLGVSHQASGVAVRSTKHTKFASTHAAAAPPTAPAAADAASTTATETRGQDV